MSSTPLAEQENKVPQNEATPHSVVQPVYPNVPLDDHTSKKCQLIPGEDCLDLARNSNKYQEYLDSISVFLGIDKESIAKHPQIYAEAYRLHLASREAIDTPNIHTARDHYKNTGGSNPLKDSISQSLA